VHRPAERRSVCIEAWRDMSRLWLKLFRDIRAYRVQAIGIAVMVMLGISMYHSFYLSFLSLGASYEWGYDRLKLADFSIEVGAGAKS